MRRFLCGFSAAVFLLTGVFAGTVFAEISLVRQHPKIRDHGAFILRRLGMTVFRDTKH
ncbi:MAG: hypothetical protein RSC29_04355 [Oscillospiraceae bacterium]